MRHLSAAAGAVALIALVSGCAPSEDSFPEAAAKAQCRRIKACDANRWENQWDGDFKACVDDSKDAIEAGLDFIDLFADCEYSAKDAGAYLRTVGTAECGSGGNQEIGDALNDVYDCGGGSDSDG